MGFDFDNNERKNSMGNYEEMAEIKMLRNLIKIEMRENAIKMMLKVNY